MKKSSKLVQGAPWIFAVVALLMTVEALNDGLAMVETTNGWRAIEVLTEGDQVGDTWIVPDMMDGMGAYLVDDGMTLRILVNHEREDDDATITEINLNKGNLKRIIEKRIQDDMGDVTFVESIRQAFDRWTGDGDKKNIGDMEWRTGTSFCRFCSSQSYEANTFGNNRGFVDRLYITGEECNDGRLFVLRSDTREMYQLSGVTGGWKNSQGNSGMPYDSFENAALIDTGEDNHIALLLSADGGTRTLKLYIGTKGFDAQGNHAGDDNFLARNGLLYGEWYYLGNVSEGSQTRSGAFVTDDSNALHANKFEDIDTNPSNPKQVVLAESESGVYILDFVLVVDDIDGFVNQDSKFTIRQITDFDFHSYQYPDNVDWTLNDLIFVNRDTGDGGIFYMSPDGNGKTEVGRTVPNAESTGILDLSRFLNYPPASIMVTTNQGSPSSMTLLVNPTLENVPGLGQDSDIIGGPSDPGPSLDPSDCPSTTSLQNQIIQAEDAAYDDAKIVTKEYGYCGEGYIDFSELSDTSGVTFEVEVPTYGMYLIAFRYSNGALSPRPGILIVNGEEIGEFSFITTERNWSHWRRESKSVELTTGRNDIEVWWYSNNKRPNIDWMSVALEHEIDK